MNESEASIFLKGNQFNFSCILAWKLFKIPILLLLLLVQEGLRVAFFGAADYFLAVAFFDIDPG